MTDFQARFLEPGELTQPTREQSLPTVICPRQGKKTIDGLLRAIREHKQQIAERMSRSGAVLFRDCAIDEVGDFEKIIRELDLVPSNDYPLGVSPRTKITDSVYTSIEAPPDIILGCHNEMAYLPYRPRWIGFYCQQAPVQYGETSIFNSRAIYQDLTPETRELLSQQKLRYGRYYIRDRSSRAFGRTWSETFGTEDKAKIEQYCSEFGATCTWLSGDGLLVENIVPAFVEHPVTAELCVNMNLCHVYERVMTRFKFSNRESASSLVKWLFRPGTLAGRRNIATRLADGKPIPLWAVRNILEATWRHSVLFRWQKGDVLLLDNILTAHGRMNVVPPRRILASFGDMYRV